MEKLIGTLALLTVLAPIAARAVACPGDCNFDGRVTAEEIVLGSRVYAHLANPDACAAADVDGNNSVSVAELVDAANAALVGFPYAPLPRPEPVEGCTNGFLAGTFSNLEDTNLTTTPLELARGQGRVHSLPFPDSTPGFFLTATLSSCPQGALSRIVNFDVHTRHTLIPGDYFVDDADVHFTYAEAQGGPSAFVHGWRAVDGVVVIDELAGESVVFHVVGAAMVPDNQGGPTGIFTVLANGGVDQLTP